MDGALVALGSVWTGGHVWRTVCWGGVEGGGESLGGGVTQEFSHVWEADGLDS